MFSYAGSSALRLAPVRRNLGLAIIAAGIWLGAALAAHAQDGTSRLGADYDIFAMGGNDPSQCAQACGEDPRCKAWSFIKAIGQCRLKHTPVQAVANGCCASGLKPGAPKPARPEEVACADYAVEALSQNDDNIANQCGYSGVLWPAVFGDAYGRCLDTSPKRRQVDRDERARSIAECRTVVTQSNDLACDHFARLSVEEMKTNRQNKCGLRGAGWSELASDHATYCRDVSRTELSDAVLVREEALRECLGRADGSSDKACDVYVQKSLAQVVRAQQLRCGRAFAGPTWTPDDAQHYAFCKAQAPRQRDAILRDRTSALEKCEQDRKRFRFILKF